MEKFDEQTVEQAKQAKSAEELLALAKENGIEMTPEEATAYFEKLNPVSGELSDEELVNVAGGGCGCNKELKWPKVGDLVLLKKSRQYCPACGSDHAYVEARGSLATKQINRNFTVRCTVCGKVYETAGAVDSFTIL